MKRDEKEKKKEERKARKKFHDTTSGGRARIGGWTRQFEISKQDVSDRERQSSGGSNNRDY